MKRPKNQFVLIISDLLKLSWLTFLDYLGLNNSSIEKKLNYISDRWFLGRSLTDDSDLFKIYIKHQTHKAEKRLNRYNSFRIRYIRNTILFFLTFTLIALIFNKLYNSVDLIIYENLIIDIAVLIYFLLFWTNPSDKRKKATYRTIEILKEVIDEKKPLDFFRNKKYSTNEKSITLPFTHSELAAFFGSIFLSEQIKGISQRQVADFIENKCKQSNGESYKDIRVMITQYKNGHVNNETALNSFYDKLKQNSIK